MRNLSEYIIKPVYAGSAPAGSGTGLGSITGSGKFQTLTSDTAIAGTFLSSIITTITVVGGLAFVIYFFIGSIKWITAGGDKGKVAEAQSQMTQGAIGLIAMVASYFIIGIVGAVLGLDILNPIKSLGF